MTRYIIRILETVTSVKECFIDASDADDAYGKAASGEVIKEEDLGAVKVTRIPSSVPMVDHPY